MCMCDYVELWSASLVFLKSMSVSWYMKSYIFFFYSHSFWLYAILSLDPHHGFPNFCYKKHRFLLCQTLSTKEIYLCVFIDDNLIYSTHLTILCGITNWPIVVNAEANIGAPFPLASLFLFLLILFFMDGFRRHIISRLDSISRSFSKANKIILHSKSNTWLQWTNKRRIYSNTQNVNCGISACSELCSHTMYVCLGSKLEFENIFLVNWFPRSLLFLHS